MCRGRGARCPSAMRSTPSHRIVAPWPCTIGRTSLRSIISRCPPPGPSTPMMQRSCMPLIPMSISPTSPRSPEDGSPGWCGRQVGNCLASMANPGKCLSVTLSPNRWPPTGKICSTRSSSRPSWTSRMPGTATCKPGRLPPGSQQSGVPVHSRQMPHRPLGSGGSRRSLSGRRVKTSLATGVGPPPWCSKIRSIPRRPPSLPCGSIPTSRVLMR